MKKNSLPKTEASREVPGKIEWCLPAGARLSDVFMDGQQVRQELFISKRTLQNWRSTGKISHTKKLGKIFYFRQEIALLLLEGKKSRAQ